MEHDENAKPYCVVFPQGVMVVIWALPFVGGLLLPLLLNRSLNVELLVACFGLVAVGIGLGYFVWRYRRVLLGRELSTVLFALLAFFSARQIVLSPEPWDTTPKCEEDVPLWNACGRRDPGGEKVAYLVLFLMFVSLAGMPWLPAGNRYYRKGQLGKGGSRPRPRPEPRCTEDA